MSAGDTTQCFIAAYSFNPVQCHDTAHPIFTASFPGFVQIAITPAITVYSSAR